MEDMICMVNNIFDKAYFLKIDFPWKSDLECFTEAERYFCEEKWIDCEAYYEYEKRIKNGISGDEKTDYEQAKKNYVAQKIKEIAYYKYQNRLRKGIELNPDMDYLEAKNQLDDEVKINRIATFCWSKHPVKNHPKERYWFLARNVFDGLKKDYQFITPITQDEYLQSVIKNAIAKDI